MRRLFFIAVANHQQRYFRNLLAHTGLPGQVLTWRGLLRHWRPFVRSGLSAGEHRIWAEEKIAERRRKGKSVSPWYRWGLHLEQRMAAAALTRLARAHDGELVIGVWNGGHRYHQMARRILERGGGQMLYFENGILPGTTTLDPQGVNYYNSVPRDPAAFYQRACPGHDHDGVTLVPRAPRCHKGDAIELPERYWFVPFQDDRDTQIREHSPWLEDMRALFDALSTHHDGRHPMLVFKEHPSSPIRYPDLHERSGPRERFANGNDTQTLIEDADAVITVNSTVGLEAILLGKPVLVLGRAFYAIPGLTLSAEGPEELAEALHRLSDWKPDPVLRRKFLDYLSRDYCVPGSWREPDRAHWRAVEARVRGYLTARKTATS